MIIENPEALKAWLTSCLGRMCDADPAALAKYVMALVKKDKDENELKVFCLDQLEVFLIKETKPFVDLLFETLKTKSYLMNSCADISVKIKNEGIRSSSPSNDSVINESVKREREIDKRLKVEESHLQSCTGKYPLNESPEKFISKCRNRENESKRYPSKSEDDNHKHYHSSKRKEKKRQTYKSRRNDAVDFDKRLQFKDSMNVADPLSHHGDTDYRLNNSHLASPHSSFLNKNNFTQEKSKAGKRCKDYDEKGYCMLGDFCFYDHGADPLVVEDVSALNFGVPATSAQNGQNVSSSSLESSSQPELPPPPTSPPPLPPPPPPPTKSITPPPPPPSPGTFVPEPYNPEAPEMNVVPREQPRYWLSKSTPIHSVTAAVPHSLGPSSCSDLQSHAHTSLFNQKEAPPFCNELQRTSRELVGVSSQADEVQSYYFKPPPNECISEAFGDKENQRERDIQNSTAIPSETTQMPTMVYSNDKKRKGFDYNRLGPPRKSLKYNADRCTLEIRKVPPLLNTIELLNTHFSKFGTVVNLEVAYNGDREAALVQFMNAFEANAAYRSSEAVFNNRFIKVFRYNKRENNQTGFAQEVSIEPSFNETNCEPTNPNFHTEEAFNKSAPSTKCNISRTIFNPTALKKNNVPSESTVRNIAQAKEKEKDSLTKRIELHKTKQNFLHSHVEHQKLILKELGKCKNVTKKDFLKKTILDIGKKISDLQVDLRKDAEYLINIAKGGTTHHMKGFRKKSEAEKELLDAELDLYNRQHSGDDISELLSKVNELKKKAKALGLISNPHVQGKNVQAQRTSVNPYPVKNHGATAASLRSIDHRTRKLFVSSSAIKEDIMKYFSQFGEVENIEQEEAGYILTFKTRKEAENVFKRDYKKEDFILSVSWHPNASTRSVDQDTIENSPEILKKSPQLVDNEDEEEEEEDEEDEDGEHRSWRR